MFNKLRLRILLIILPLLVNGLMLRAQTAPRAGDQNQASSSAAKKNSKQEPADPSKAASTLLPRTGSTPRGDSAKTAQTPTARTQTAPPASTTTTVSVNTESGIYHKPGSRYYGKTKKGKYMTEADARKAGYREAKKE